MKFATILAVMVSLTVGSVFAQDFDNLNLLNVASATSAPASGQGAPGPAAPYGYYNGGYYQDYYRQSFEWRYSSVQQALKQYASYYGWFSREREYYNAQRRQGEDLWVRYLRYRDAYSAAALSNWCAYWERALYAGGSWYNGGYNNGGYYGNGGYYDYGYNGGYSNGGYYDYGYHTYPRGSWGYQPWYANENFVHGVGIGDGIGHIVNGSRNRNDLETVGGILSTAGNVINVINGARRY